MSTSDSAPRPGYHTITPSITVRNGAAAIDYYVAAFGARVRFRLDEPGGKVAHAELEIGDSVFMLADEYPEYGAVSPAAGGGTPSRLGLYVTDADATLARAVAAGGELLMPASDQFYGDRSGQVRDPFGHVWSIATFVEDVSNEEMKRRFDAWCQTA
jgi:PhnB protein